MVTAEHWEKFTCSSTDGLKLAGRKYGWDNPIDKTVVCLAGLTRNSADFHDLAVFLASDEGGNYRVFTIDYRGRGDSEYDRNWKNYDLLVEATDVISMLDAAGLEHVHVIGTSRGGMIAMVLSAIRPAILGSVVLNDVGPVIEGAGLVRIKRSLESMRAPKNWPEAVSGLKAYAESQFPDMTDSDWLKQAHLIYKDVAGLPVHRYDRNLLKGLKAINLDIRLPDMWAQFQGLTYIPVLGIRGENSDILSRETLEKMAEAHPNFEFIEVKGQGHAPDLGSAGIRAEIADFLKKLD